MNTFKSAQQKHNNTYLLLIIKLLESRILLILNLSLNNKKRVSPVASSCLVKSGRLQPAVGGGAVCGVLHGFEYPETEHQGEGGKLAAARETV